MSFYIKKYLHRFTNISVRHQLELVGFHTVISIEGVYQQFCKQLMYVKKCTQYITLFVVNLLKCRPTCINIIALLIVDKDIALWLNKI